MKIYNTLTRRKEYFEPLEEGKVKMYACGITVSGEAHIGHAYQALIYDIMRKFLEKIGYEVTYARNYTDVDDKIINKSRETGIPADKYAADMIVKINAVMREFDVDDPTIWLKATENMDNMISFIEKLVAKGVAYPAENGDVFFDVNSFPEYGKLSHNTLANLKEAVRDEIEVSPYKRDPLDFALWKAEKEGEISWDSPWGRGRPGWHIECSAMNMAAFGEQIDIHGGGRDLIFPHHENEIAQTESLTGKQFAKYWTHNGLIKVNGQKMSKSLGNSLLLEDLLKEYTNEAIKFALLQYSYRQDINITDNLFSDAEKHLTSFYTVLNAVEKKYGDGKDTDGNPEIDELFVRDMSDDFNTALALSRLFSHFKAIQAKLDAGDPSCAADARQIRKTYSLLGLFKKRSESYLEEVKEKRKEEAVPEDIKEMAERRWQAKKDRNFAEADEIRNKLDSLGWSVKDSKEGYEIIKK